MYEIIQSYHSNFWIRINRTNSNLTITSDTRIEWELFKKEITNRLYRTYIDNDGMLGIHTSGCFVVRRDITDVETVWWTRSCKVRNTKSSTKHLSNRIIEHCQHMHRRHMPRMITRLLEISMHVVYYLFSLSLVFAFPRNPRWEAALGQTIARVINDKRLARQRFSVGKAWRHSIRQLANRKLSGSESNVRVPSDRSKFSCDKRPLTRS